MKFPFYLPGLYKMQNVTCAVWVPGYRVSKQNTRVPCFSDQGGWASVNIRGWDLASWEGSTSHKKMGGWGKGVVFGDLGVKMMGWCCLQTARYAPIVFCWLPAQESSKSGFHTTYGPYIHPTLWWLIKKNTFIYIILTVLALPCCEQAFLQLRCTDFSPWWLLLLHSTGFRVHGFQ